MTLAPTPAARARRKRRPSMLGWTLRALLAVVVFALGVAVGQALEDRPQPARPVTSVATIQPWTETRSGTVTVTVTAP
jgi:hypothetical protein